MKKTYYITTPIYYPSNKLHIGNTYTTVATDCVARYKKLRGFDVKYLTGTDEHGQKIEKVAREAGKEPIEFLDEMIEWIKNLWKTMDVEYDYFIRTTSDFHINVVQKIFRKLYDQGDIYKSSYEGLYCVPCETFFTDRQLKDNKCPDCGRAVEPVKEEAYFFKLSKYAARLIKYYEDHPDFIVPHFRKNEMLQNFLLPGLEDLCVSRTTFKWGVPVDFDEKHVVYVWIDALTNYLTALGFMQENDADYKKYWPADVHFVGKDIMRFHVIIWPILLMALELPLPKQVFVHGFYTVDGEKMSKSKGNMVDPTELVARYGVDAMRYFLLRELPYGADGNFTNEALVQRINFDLANDLGNLLSRTVGMIEKYFGGTLPEEHIPTEFDGALHEAVKTAVSGMEQALDKFMFADSLNAIWTLIRRANKYCDETQPWVLIKDEGKKSELANVMYRLCEVLRVTAVLITPFMPNTPNEIYRQLGILESERGWDTLSLSGVLHKNISVTKGSSIFPRLDLAKELAELSAENGAQKAALQIPQENRPQENQKDDAKAEENKPEITIEDFAKLDLRIGEIMECETVKGSDRLLKSQVQIGDKRVQIVSGIAKHYSAEQMVGKRVIVVTNLKPVKLRGELSHGMLLAASDENGALNIIIPDGAIGNGALVK